LGQIEIETAFLHAELENELQMSIPGGCPDYMKENHNITVDPKIQYLKQTRTIYGLGKSA
jgi:hypothetical protein